MEDSLTQSVLDYQQGLVPLEIARNQVLVETFAHLRRYRRKGEDEVSEFLLEFHGRIEGLMTRFKPQGLPFRHFLLRTLRWQWNTFRAERSRRRRQSWLAADAGLSVSDPDAVAEPLGEGWEAGRLSTLPPTVRRRLVLLALKASPFLDEGQLEAVSLQTGADLAWLQACQHRLKEATDLRRCRREALLQKRGDAFYRRLMAEDDARREVDPARREVHERRAGLYRMRLANLTRQQNALSTAPTHRELSHLLGMPKGSIDSGLYHLKKDWGPVYSGTHDDDPPGHQQRPQKERA